MHDMIPKLLHFVWFGETVPKYAEFSIDAFRRVNPGFEVMLTHRTVGELWEIMHGDYTKHFADEAIGRAFDRVLNKEGDAFVMRQAEMYRGCRKTIQLLSDVARIELLNEFGGIYLDCDTFPIQPFDGELLSKGFFRVEKRTCGGTAPDNFFMGKSVWHPPVTDPYDVPDAFKVVHDQPTFRAEYLVNRKRFFDLELRYPEHTLGPGCYVDHYQDGKWRNYGAGIQAMETDAAIWK